jgi:isopentenyl diphosphate isomerase/L-lactate dehydrogenase-like FMN-dependent dehydrogenase
MNSRREFLSFLAASPLALAQPVAITDPKDALSVLDFEEAARRALPIAHFAYITTGVDDDATLKANREGFTKIQLRPRRLVDVSKVDSSVDLFGVRWPSPIYICPCGSQKAFHQDGELATARAARAKNAVQMLSTVSSTSVEDVAEARRGINSTHRRSGMESRSWCRAWKPRAVRCWFSPWIRTAAAILKRRSA